MRVTVVLQSWEFPGENLKLALEGKERPKKKADHSRLVDGRFNKQENLHIELVLGNYKTSRSPHPPTRFLKLYIKALTGFNHVHSSDGLNYALLSQGCVLVMTPSVATVGKNVHSKDREGGKESPVPSLRVNWWSRPVDDLLQYLCNIKPSMLSINLLTTLNSSYLVYVPGSLTQF